VNCRICGKVTVKVSTVANTHKNVSILYKDINTRVDNKLRLELFYCDNASNIKLMILQRTIIMKNI
jgi:hypothetical protein